MRTIFKSMFLVAALAIVTHGAVLSAYAAEGEKAVSDKPPDVAKESGGEGEGGKKKTSDDVSGGRFAGDPVYVHIAPMVLPIITEQGVEQLVTIVMDVEVKDFDVADTMHTKMPKVRDALMRALYGGLGQGNLRKGKLVDINKIKAKATTALGEVIGADGIREVLIQGVSQRML